MGTIGEALIPGYRRDLTSARRRLTEPSVPVHRLDVPEGCIEYARYGTGPTVLVLHGSGGGWDQGVNWARSRLAEGCDVIAVSRFGYLGSTLPAGATTSAQADAYATLLDALDVQQADLVTLSAGSMTGIRFAGEHADRVRRLVLESPMLPTRKPVRLPPAGAYRLFAAAEPLLWALTKSPALTRLAAGVPARELDAAARAELAEINATAFLWLPGSPGWSSTERWPCPSCTETTSPSSRSPRPPLSLTPPMPRSHRTTTPRPSPVG